MNVLVDQRRDGTHSRGVGEDSYSLGDQAVRGTQLTAVAGGLNHQRGRPEIEWPTPLDSRNGQGAPDAQTSAAVAGSNPTDVLVDQPIAVTQGASVGEDPHPTDSPDGQSIGDIQKSAAAGAPNLKETAR
jgi:hypothetical protein